MASAEGINPSVLFNFNENDATNIRDYSDNGYDGTGSNLTISATTRSIGYDAVFNGTTSEIDTSIGNINNEFHIYLSINITSNTGADLIVYETTGAIQVYYDGFNIYCRLDTGSGIDNVFASVSTGVWYDIYFEWDGSNLTAYKDGVQTSQQSTSGTLSISNADIHIGHRNNADHSAFKLNEFRFYQDVDASDLMPYIIAEQNGVLIKSDKAHQFNIGDIVGYNIGLSDGSYGIVTYIATDTNYRVQPISNNLTNGMRFTRCGHLWDTDRQWLFVIDNTPQISFYDGISKTTEVASSTKKMYSLTREGIIKNSSTKTANYTILNTDQRIYVDSSGGTFTITLESSPTTNREIEIIDSTGNCGTYNVTVNGNGNNINGSSTRLIETNNDALDLVYNGTQWNLK